MNRTFKILKAENFQMIKMSLDTNNNIYSQKFH